MVPERISKLREGQRYLYLVTKQDMYFGVIQRQYTGIFSGFDDEGNLVFKNVEFLHLPYSKRLNVLSNPDATIPIEKISHNVDFLPVDPSTGDPIEISSYDELEEKIIRASIF